MREAKRRGEQRRKEQRRQMREEMGRHQKRSEEKRRRERRRREEKRREEKRRENARRQQHPEHSKPRQHQRHLQASRQHPLKLVIHNGSMQHRCPETLAQRDRTAEAKPILLNYVGKVCKTVEIPPPERPGWNLQDPVVCLGGAVPQPGCVFKER